jgi:4'-phosphopantetheinyl transferase
VTGIIDLHLTRLDRRAAEVDDDRALLAPEERARADQFVHEQHRRRFTAARAALRRLLGEVLRAPADALVFETGAHGKPALAGRWRGALEFNVTHAHELALYAVRTDGPVGVDVEWRRAVPDCLDIARSHFAPGERAALEAVSAADRELAFFRCWTRKEAFIKATGEGLSHPLDRFEVTLAPGDPPRFLSIDGDANAAAGWSLFSLEPAPGYLAAVAAPGRLALALRWSNPRRLE